MTNEISKIEIQTAVAAATKVVAETSPSASKDSVRDSGKVRYGSGTLRF